MSNCFPKWLQNFRISKAIRKSFHWLVGVLSRSDIVCSFGLGHTEKNGLGWMLSHKWDISINPLPYKTQGTSQKRRQMFFLLINVYQIPGVVPDLQQIEWKKNWWFNCPHKNCFSFTVSLLPRQNNIWNPTLEISALGFVVSFFNYCCCCHYFIIIIDIGSHTMAQTGLDSMCSLGWPWTHSIPFTSASWD